MKRNNKCSTNEKWMDKTGNNPSQENSEERPSVSLMDFQV